MASRTPRAPRSDESADDTTRDYLHGWAALTRRIEQGASWLPSWMRYMDSAFEAFRTREERLQTLSLRPSDYVKRQVRVTPYPAEDAGWIIENSGDEICLFSSDYPHVEGGRNPIRRFEESMKNLSEAQKRHFYFDNMVDLMGSSLAG